METQSTQTVQAELRDCISLVLEKHGWKPFNGPAIALKHFETAVGIKQASVHLSKGMALTEP